jgi:hypothetical protein
MCRVQGDVEIINETQNEPPKWACPTAVQSLSLKHVRAMVRVLVTIEPSRLRPTKAEWPDSWPA